MPYCTSHVVVVFQNKSVVSWGLHSLMSDGGDPRVNSLGFGALHMFCLMWTSLIYTGPERRDKNEAHKHLLLKNTENRTSSRTTYDIFLGSRSLLFRPQKFCINKKTSILKRLLASVATDFPWNLCLPYWADVSYEPQPKWRIPLFVFLARCLLHTIFDWQIKGGNDDDATPEKKAHAKS